MVHGPDPAPRAILSGLWGPGRPGNLRAGLAEVQGLMPYLGLQGPVTWTRPLVAQR